MLVEHRHNFRIGDHPGQAIGAEQQAIPVHQLEGPDLGLDSPPRAAREIAEDVSGRMRADRLGRDLAGVGKALRQRVVSG